MPESPLDVSPYEVLGVSASATPEELKRAFRRALRETHPDTGGDPQRFAAVQLAWQRVGTVEARAAYDAGRSQASGNSSFAARPATPRADSRPRARSYGHPGGWRRERYLEQIREWAGRGVELDDPYDARLVRDAPQPIRRALADALAEEHTARSLSTLGIGFTMWHDVATGTPGGKVDHVVLGPTGLWAMMSEDFGGPVRVRRGELIGDGVAGERPVHDLASGAKALTRAWKVRFSALVIVVPDDTIDEPIVALGTIRGAQAVATRQSTVAHLLRTGLPGTRTIGGTEIFDIRTRIAAGVRYL
ncbi:hypothetical protein M2152_001058 [Microbacteriaceae bacterium SG_E_30_P1]|uniref:J domain-containing protein n=1 Tax=Antiquaquibacter oligotrophicus TaxID=2880260 RepID=A0ABT6KLH2_9MICO|nr:J domain-containing protein [Antiquaquibacter oligotrophicus]MDH6180876.1 hypothetical protein [Antiquaquibacter oligotrophicus]UDF13415.1 J domain-containing protein [Antiquaquibacter oligotrophicus]